MTVNRSRSGKNHPAPVGGEAPVRLVLPLRGRRVRGAQRVAPRGAGGGAGARHVFE